MTGIINCIIIKQYRRLLCRLYVNGKQHVPRLSTQKALKFLYGVLPVKQTDEKSKICSSTKCRGAFFMPRSDNIDYTFLMESGYLAFSGNGGCCSIRCMQKSWLLIVLLIQSEAHSNVLFSTFPKSLPQVRCPDIFQPWTCFVSVSAGI